ncbi:HD domain-containing protein [Bacillus sp. REN16]|uniref:HD domain-containing protein n=1 Tax=Bacillus sp. REN16 TaxID=2887296 RepID=UPI001E29F804|nr:HD domain-containing protein [Bacillus sp. REN16]MCC3358423.1 HD domain-containing protein [Bacillus sp. REN16]
MEQQQIIEATTTFVKNILKHDSSGHDWWHIERVRKAAIQIGELEKADLFIIEMAALLHDVADEKLNNSEEEGLRNVRDWLSSLHISFLEQEKILEIISTMSFKGGNRAAMKTIEGQVVQDADRLDAIGAIGIARTFAYAGSHGDLMYDPDLPYRDNMTKEEYRNGKSTAVNHFYEKLLKLKDTLNTNAAKDVAQERHDFMIAFLNQFYKEWNGQL